MSRITCYARFGFAELKVEPKHSSRQLDCVVQYLAEGSYDWTVKAGFFPGAAVKSRGAGSPSTTSLVLLGCGSAHLLHDLEVTWPGRGS